MLPVVSRHAMMLSSWCRTDMTAAASRSYSAYITTSAAERMSRLIDTGCAGRSLQIHHNDGVR